MIDIKGNILFSVQLLHKYYSNGLCPDFSFVPSPTTAAVLSGCQLLCKSYQSQLFVAARFNNGLATPAMIIPPANTPLTFLLQCNNPLFFNFTDLPLPGLNQKLLYFTNRNNNIAGAQKLLTVAAAGNATAADLLTFVPAQSQYPMPAAGTTVTYHVMGYNAAVGDYSTQVVAPATLNFTLPVSTFPLDLSALPAGKYILQITAPAAVTTPIYVNPDLTGTSDYRGVIEIYTDPAVPAGYAVFGAANTLLSPSYFVSFLNRSTIWQYVLVSTKTTTLTDAAGVYSFTCVVPGSPPVIVTLTSNTPIPLSQTVQNFSLSQAGAFTLKHIPCADPQQLRLITIGAIQYYCSMIYVNY